MQLILASQSPRRREILRYFSLPFEAITSQFDEDSIPFTGNPETYVLTLASGKASALSQSYPEAAILGADTIVYRHGKVYGKPRTEKEANATLTELAGQWHSVYTGVVLTYQGNIFQTTEETRVLFNSLTLAQIKHYHTSLHLYDKAGSYQLQNAGGLIVNRIEGCYYNVVGLPINSVRTLLQKIGIELWDHLQ
ncbi:MAG: Maf family protein [Parachlamydiaceae bacterium]